MRGRRWKHRNFWEKFLFWSVKTKPGNISTTRRKGGGWWLLSSLPVCRHRLKTAGRAEWQLLTCQRNGSTSSYSDLLTPLQCAFLSLCLSLSCSPFLLPSLSPFLTFSLSSFLPALNKSTEFLNFLCYAAHMHCGTCVEVRGFLGLSFRGNSPWHGSRGLDSVCQALSLGTGPDPLSYLSASKSLLWLAVSHLVSRYRVKSFFRNFLLTSKPKDARTRGYLVFFLCWLWFEYE